jgi:hypothetical protein
VIGVAEHHGVELRIRPVDDPSGDPFLEVDAVLELRQERLVGLPYVQPPGNAWDDLGQLPSRLGRVDAVEGLERIVPTGDDDAVLQGLGGIGIRKGHQGGSVPRSVEPAGQGGRPAGAAGDQIEVVAGPPGHEAEDPVLSGVHPGDEAGERDGSDRGDGGHERSRLSPIDEGPQVLQPPLLPGLLDHHPVGGVPSEDEEPGFGVLSHGTTSRSDGIVDGGTVWRAIIRQGSKASVGLG